MKIMSDCDTLVVVYRYVHRVKIITNFQEDFVMKKLLVLVLAVLALTAFAACKSEEEKAMDALEDAFSDLM